MVLRELLGASTLPAAETHYRNVCYSVSPTSALSENVHTLNIQHLLAH